MVNVTEVLEVRRGAQGREYALDKEIMLIGRGPENDIVLIDKYVSGQHAKLQWTKGYLYVIDMGSKNGTVLNGSKLDKDIPYPYKTGDVISIGDFTLTLRARQREVTPPPPKSPGSPAVQPGQVQPQNIFISIWFRIAMVVLIIAGLAALTWLVLPMLMQPNQEQVAAPASIAVNNTPQQGQTAPAVVSQPGLTTYVNTAYGYRLVYPDGWNIDSGDEARGAIIISELPAKSAEIAINVQQQALDKSIDAWLTVIKKMDSNTVVLQNDKGTGIWDWYVRWNSHRLIDPSVTLLNEAYFKYKGGATYMLWTYAPLGQYEAYPYKNVVNSFQLTGQ